MSDIADAHLKIGRANKHISDLRVAKFAFLSDDPCTVVGRYDYQQGHTSIRVDKFNAPPREISLVAGDALHNLRSALDLLACALVKRNGYEPTSKVYFPISDTLAKYESHSRSKVPGMSDADKVAIDAFKPYQSGNDLLWVLHRLDIEDKHRVVSIPMIAVGTIGMHLTNEFIERELKKTAPPSGWGSVEPQTFWFDIPCQPPTKVGDELVIVKWNCEGKEDIKIAFDIAISEPVTMKRWPLVQTLEQMSELVAGIVNSFEKT